LRITERNENSVERTSYTIFYFNPAKPDQLSIAQTTADRDGSNVDKRHNNLSSSIFFLRQGNSTPPPPVEETPPPADTPPTTVDPALSGTWESPCFADADDSTFSTVTYIMDVADTSLSAVVRNFVDDACITPTTSGAVITFKGNFMLGNVITTGDGVTAQEIDRLFTEANGISFKLENYTLVYIDPAKPDELVWGQATTDRDGTSVDKRHNTLNFRSVFFRQGATNRSVSQPLSKISPDKLLCVHYGPLGPC